MTQTEIMQITGESGKTEEGKKPMTRTLEEQRVIDEAKAVLIARKGMQEPEAYRYIQKTSMDTSRSMIETAGMILLLNGEL